jgi:HEAT repeat protein
MALFLLLALPQDFPSLLEGLRAVDADARAKAFQLILDRFDEWTEPDLDRLRKASGDADVELAERAKEALGRLQARKTLGGKLARVEGLDLALLRGTDAARRRGLEAAGAAWRGRRLETSELQRLIEIGLKQEWRPSLEDLETLIQGQHVGPYGAFALRSLRDADPDIRRQALAILATEAAKTFSGDVLPLLKDPMPFVRSEGVHTLVQMDARDRIRDILPLLADRKPGVISRALEAIWRFQAIAHAPSILPLLKHPDPQLRVDAMNALGNVGARDHADALVPLLQDPSLEARAFALETLGRLGGADHVKLILPALDAREGPLRAAAAKALGWIRAKDQAKRLVELLKDQDSDVINAASSALGDLRAVDQAGAVEELLKNPRTRMTAVNTLRAMKARGSAARLVPLLQEEDSFLRFSLAQTFMAFKAVEHAHHLLPLLDDPLPLASTQAISAIGYLGRSDTLEKLLPLLGREDPELRRVALDALGSSGRVEHASAVARLLRDDQPRVRGYAIDALGDLEAADRLPDLLPLLEDPSVRDRAALVVGTLGGLLQNKVPEGTLEKLEKVPGPAGLLARASFKEPDVKALREVDAFALESHQAKRVYFRLVDRAGSTSAFPKLRAAVRFDKALSTSEGLAELLRARGLSLKMDPEEELDPWIPEGVRLSLLSVLERAHSYLIPVLDGDTVSFIPEEKAFARARRILSHD